MTSDPANYHAYLLRLRREDEEAPWRAELVSPHTGDKHQFATETELYRFLTGLLASDNQPDSEQK